MFEINAAHVVLTVCFANLLPVAYELTLNFLRSRGYNLDQYTRLTQLTRAIDKFNNWAELLLAATTLGFIGTAAYLHVTAFHPATCGHETASSVLLFHVLPSLFLNGNMLVNFALCIVVSPGTTRTTAAGADVTLKQSLASDIYAKIVRALRNHNLTPEQLTPEQTKNALAVLDIRYCTTCKAVKPDRTHHCSTCNHCVMVFDHHCPFTHCCVGAGNLRFFVLFIMYTVLSAIYAMYLTWPTYRHCVLEWDDALRNDALHSESNDVDHCNELGARQHLFLLACFTTLILGIFYSIISSLACVGKTMHEFLYPPTKPPKSSRDSLRAAFRVHYGVNNPSLVAKYLANLEIVFGPKKRWPMYLVPGLEYWMSYKTISGARKQDV